MSYHTAEMSVQADVASRPLSSSLPCPYLNLLQLSETSFFYFYKSHLNDFTLINLMDLKDEVYYVHLL